ncbi:MULTISPECIES: ExeM/NucH family extracellular endonuclease [unclassified Janthinobacterium]|uniref:ExeM/NucH family extracellular endonuclease n=1 Tax=unclassified Janthinobacterium TaxID=2610881 RepID=UPI00037B242F|nr:MULTISPECIES: ExeM/NucH family extracellular endonuclease [unclassified Janthinobacterium]MEC5163368.1 putative extracellular nuclease [Janthinobacterium sp. CG_S6]
MKNRFLTIPAPAARPSGRLSAMAALAAGLCGPALAASDVVISQVYGGGGNAGALYRNDFIEVFNRGAGVVDVANWSVQYASAAGANWAVTALPGMLLQPGQYLLVQQAKGGGGSVDLPAADASGATALSGSAGKVLLSNSRSALSGTNPSGPAVLDLVGFGTAGGFETAAAPAPSNTTAILRGAGGCADSDNNGADFSAAAPQPRNSASPRKVCGAPPAPQVLASCPASLALASGSGGGAALSARDADGVVRSAAFSSAPAAGVTLADFAAAAGAGQSASVRLAVAAGVADGNYALEVKFDSDQGRSGSCRIALSVQGAAGVTHTIPQIQGAGPASPYANSVQTSEGVVTLLVGTGFFMQDADGDGDPATSDGIFVYTGAAAAGVAVGERVRVTGTVVEYTPSGAARSYTEFKDVTALLGRGAGPAVAPLNLDLPNARLDQVEGMLVRFTRPLTVAQTGFLGTRGELTLAAGRLEVPTNRHPPGSAEALALAAANAVNMLVLDDGLFVTPTLIPYIGQDGTVRAGDSVLGLTGVVDFGAIGGGGAAFKLQPTAAPQFSRDNPRTAAPQFAPGNVKVASANVLNFFTTFTNGANVSGQTGQGCTLGATTSSANCRGADNLAEFRRQRDKIVAALKAIDADVVGLMEIQNNGELAVSYLVEQLNAAIGAPAYAYVPKPAATGSDAIRVAMIYKPGKLELVGAALADADAVNNRPPMAQTFRAGNGEKFSLIVNHLKSKGGCPGAGADADQGDGQACWNALRVRQARRLLEHFVPQVVAAAGDADVLLIGDLNSHGFEDPVNVLTGGGFANQLERFVRPLGMPYSYVFDGESGYLDHALASAALQRQVAGAGEWHINADEPSVIDYNTDGKPQDLYNALPYRASDHDPVVVSLDLRPAVLDVSASVASFSSGLAYNRVTHQYSGTLSLSNTSGAAVSGPLHVALAGLPAGVTLLNASGNHAGAPYVTLAAAALAPGATASVALRFANPAKTPISYTSAIFSGNF